MAVLASGSRPAHALSAVSGLIQQLCTRTSAPGIVTLIGLIILAILSGIILERSGGGRKVGCVRLRTAILVLATVSFGMVLRTSRLGGELRHSELESGSQTTSLPPIVERVRPRSCPQLFMLCLQNVEY